MSGYVDGGLVALVEGIVVDVVDAIDDEGVAFDLNLMCFFHFIGLF